MHIALSCEGYFLSPRKTPTLKNLRVRLLKLGRTHCGLESEWIASTRIWALSSRSAGWLTAPQRPALFEPHQRQREKKVQKRKRKGRRVFFLLSLLLIYSIPFFLKCYKARQPQYTYSLQPNALLSSLHQLAVPQSYTLEYSFCVCSER